MHVAIDAPPLIPPANGLLNSAQVVEVTDERWLGGVSFVPECGNVSVTEIGCGQDFGGEISETPESEIIIPFEVSAGTGCSVYGRLSAQEYEAKARRFLLAHETSGVEEAFWDNTSIHLADDDRVTVYDADSPETPRNALALLTQGIADLKLGRGMIHARPSLVNQWAAENQLRWEGNRLYTLTGALVVPGSGYPGTGPEGQSASFFSEWAYASEVVEIRRGPITFPITFEEAFDRTNNTVEIFASRAYAVVLNGCGIAAVNVNSTGIVP